MKVVKKMFFFWGGGGGGVYFFREIPTSPWVPFSAKFTPYGDYFTLVPPSLFPAIAKDISHMAGKGLTVKKGRGADSIMSNTLKHCVHVCVNMGYNVRQPVFGVSDTVRFKPACSATETS